MMGARGMSAMLLVAVVLMGISPSAASADSSFLSGGAGLPWAYSYGPISAPEAVGPAVSIGNCVWDNGVPPYGDGWSYSPDIVVTA
jgi:hypothetical protein